MKRIIFLLIVLIVATAAMAYLYFSRINEKNGENDTALNVATYHAAMVFAFNSDRNFYQLMNEQTLFSDFLGTEKTAELQQAGRQFIENNGFYNIIKDKKTYISVIPDNRDIALLLTIQLTDAKQQSDLMAAMQKKGLTRPIAQNLFSLQLSDSLSLFTGVKGALIFVSSSEGIIKERLAKDMPTRDTEFENYTSAVVGTNKNSLMNLFVNFKNFTPLLKEMTAGSTDGELAKLNGQNSFADLSYNFSKEKILFHGTTVVNDDKSYYQLFSSLEPQTFSINNILPSGTANYSVFAIDNYNKWLGKLDGYFKKTNKAGKVNGILSLVKKKYLADLRASFSKYFNNQFITFQLRSGEKLGAIALNNGTKIKQLLIDMSAPYDDEISIFKDNDLLYSLFGDVFSRFGRPYYVVKGNYLIFANNASTIQSFNRSYDNNDLLVNEQFYIDFRNQFPATGNISFYINLKASKDIFRNALHLEYYKHFLANNGLGEYESFCYQLNGDKGKFQTSMVIAKGAPESADSVIISK